MVVRPPGKAKLVPLFSFFRYFHKRRNCLDGFFKSLDPILLLGGNVKSRKANRLV